MKVLITGSNGFIGRNLEVYLCKKNINILTFNRKDPIKKLYDNLLKSDVICHIAGENRPLDPNLFFINNTLLTKKICDFLLKKKKKIKIIFTSTTQVSKNNLYSKSKKKCENILLDYKKKTNANISILRLPNVFGKWSKPNYNSVIATFCYNISRTMKIRVFNRKESVNLIYIDDVILQIYKLLKNLDKNTFPKILNIKRIKVSRVAEKIQDFKKNINTQYLNILESKLDKDLYSTFISFLPKKNFFTNIKSNRDDRGNFAEFIKSENYGQISFFSIKKNKERGGHFHNSKVEKFLIIRGSAKIFYRNLHNDSFFTKRITENNLKIFHSIPGWVHTIKNIGKIDLIGIVWANEIFDKKRPDTYKYIDA